MIYDEFTIESLDHPKIGDSIQHFSPKYSSLMNERRMGVQHYPFLRARVNKNGAVSVKEMCPCKGPGR